MGEHGMWPWRASSALKAILSSALGHKHLGHLIFQSELLGGDWRQYNSAQSIDIHRVCLILPNSMYCSHGCCDSALELQLGVLFLSHLPSSLLGSCYFKDEFRPNQLIIFFFFYPPHFLSNNSYFLLVIFLSFQVIFPCLPVSQSVEVMNIMVGVSSLDTSFHLSIPLLAYEKAYVFKSACRR